MTVGPLPQDHPASREPLLSTNIRCAGQPATSGSRGSRRLGVKNPYGLLFRVARRHASEHCEPQAQQPDGKRTASLEASYPMNAAWTVKSALRVTHGGGVRGTSRKSRSRQPCRPRPPCQRLTLDALIGKCELTVSYD